MPSAQAKSERYLTNIPGTVRVSTEMDPNKQAEGQYTGVVFSENDGLKEVLSLLKVNPSILLQSEAKGDLSADGQPVKRLALFQGLIDIMRTDD